MAPVPIIIKIMFFLLTRLMVDKYTKQNLECGHSSENKSFYKCSVVIWEAPAWCILNRDHEQDPSFQVHGQDASKKGITRQQRPYTVGSLRRIRRQKRMRTGPLDMGHCWERVLEGRSFSAASPRHSGPGSAPGTESRQETGQPASPRQETDSQKADTQQSWVSAESGLTLLPKRFKRHQ